MSGSSAQEQSVVRPKRSIAGNQRPILFIVFLFTNRINRIKNGDRTLLRNEIDQRIAVSHIVCHIYFDRIFLAAARQRQFDPFDERAAAESGDGFGDILIRIEDEDVGIVIEVKYADDGNLQGECEKALQQIIDIRYTEALEQEGIHTIIKYGIACYRKKCKVLMRIDKQ